MTTRLALATAATCALIGLWLVLNQIEHSGPHVPAPNNPSGSALHDSETVPLRDVETWMQGARERASIRFVPDQMEASASERPVLAEINGSLGPLSPQEWSTVMTHLEKKARHLLTDLERQMKTTKNDLATQIRLADLQLLYEQYVCAASCLQKGSYYVAQQADLLGIPGAQTVITPIRRPTGSADVVFVLHEENFPQLAQLRRYRETLVYERAKEAVSRFNAQDHPMRAAAVSAMLEPPANEDARRRSAQLRQEYLLSGVRVDRERMLLFLEKPEDR